MESPVSDQESEMDVELRMALKEASLEAGVSLSARLYPSALLWLGSVDAAPASKLRKWLLSTRRRTRFLRPRFSLQAGPQTAIVEYFESSRPESSVDSDNLVSPSSQGLSLKDRLSKAVEIDINSPSFTWETLVSLHRSEHAGSTESTEDDISKPLEVTVNSGGVVYFAMFKRTSGEREAAAVLKFTSSRLATQSERLGYEITRHMGVFCPQSRVIRKGSIEWEQLKAAVEKWSISTAADGAEENEVTCKEFIEALNLSQCVLLMGYMRGCPWLESEHTFKSEVAAKTTAAALGRVFLLDLVLRNEDRLPCSQLGWRGNPGNLLCTEEPPIGHRDCMHVLSAGAHVKILNEKDVSGEKKFPSLDSLQALQSHNPLLHMDSQPDAQPLRDVGDFFLVTIDSGVPRRPPTGKQLQDRLNYPRMIELILNSTDYASSILHEISAGHLGCPSADDKMCGRLGDGTNQSQIVREFQSGLRRGIRNMQNLYIFLLKLHRLFEILLRKFFWSFHKSLSSEEDGCFHSHTKGLEVSPTQNAGKRDSPKPLLTQQHPKENCMEGSGGPTRSANSGSPSDKLMESELPKLSKRLTLKLKDFNKNAKVDTKLNDELNHWNEMLYLEGRLLCQESGFVTGFLERGGSHSVVDSYELKVRLEHLLERMRLISQAADTERPSQVLENLYIGGALAAKSIHSLQYVGITHVLCLCPSELRSFGDELSAKFTYKEIQVLDLDTEDVSSIFKEACDFIDDSTMAGGKTLVHCFEGRSRSATVVLAYLMLRKNQTLSQAWIQLKAAHSRVRPNDGFMQALGVLDRQLYGTNSMDWQKKKPSLHVCDICGKTAGLSISSLRYHQEKAHPGAHTLS